MFGYISLSCSPDQALRGLTVSDCVHTQFSELGYYTKHCSSLQEHCGNTERTLREHWENTVSLGQFYWFDPGFVMWPTSCQLFNRRVRPSRSECKVFLSASRVRLYWTPSGSQPTAFWCCGVLGQWMWHALWICWFWQPTAEGPFSFWWVVWSKKMSEKGLNLFPEPTWRSSNVLLDPQPKDFKFTVIGDDAKQRFLPFQ